VSGLTISDVVINQYDARLSPNEAVPTSFKDLADATIGNEENRIGSHITSATSIFVNAAFLAYSLTRSGDVFNSFFGIDMDPTAISVIFSAAISSMICSLSNAQVSSLSSLLVGCLFTTFGGFLFPGLTSMQDPTLTLATEGTVGVGAIGLVVPILVSAAMYQNIVPSVAKLLDYDRTRVTAALAIGSGLPIIMYLAFCLASLGGGIHADSLSSCPLFGAFAVTSLAVSSLACVNSISEEYESVLSSVGIMKENHFNKVDDQKDRIVSIPSVLLAVLPPLIAGVLFADGGAFTSALKLAGNYGAPILYGIIPAMMIWNKKNVRSEEKIYINNMSNTMSKRQQTPNMSTGSMMGAAGLSLSSFGLMAHGALTDFDYLLGNFT